MTYKTINCDQVAWLQNALTRFGDSVRLTQHQPRVCRYRLTNELACLLEIMEVLGLRFEDEAAQDNALIPVKGLSGVSPVKPRRTDCRDEFKE